ncbi:MAG: ATP-dependent metalloprotease FtsH, partial [Blastococcus sp.]|nr:ATP-dependent metalloprotease FtsH [Blastococcus sp.]
MERKKIFRSPWFWVVLVVLLALAFSSLMGGNSGYQEVSTSTALAQFDDGNVAKATINDKEQTLDLDLKKSVEGSDKVTTAYPLGASDDIFALVSGTGEGNGSGVNFDTNVTQDSLLVSLLVSFLPFLILLLLLFWLFNSMQGGGRGVMAFGKSKAKQVTKDTPKTTFADVAGADEAVEELYEIKDFLQNPVKFQAVGA